MLLVYNNHIISKYYKHVLGSIAKFRVINPQLVPSRSVLLKFEGQILPEAVSIYKVWHTVLPYIPRVQICFACFRFGHIGANCRRKTRCGRCGGLRHAGITECSRASLPPICINCKGEHLPTQPSCPEFVKQKQIQILAFEENIPMLEARNRICKGHLSRLIENYISNKDYPSLSIRSQEHDHNYTRQAPMRKGGDRRSADYNPYSVLQNDESEEVWGGAFFGDPRPPSFAAIVRGSSQRGRPPAPPEREPRPPPSGGGGRGGAGRGPLLLSPLPLYVLTATMRLFSGILIRSTVLEMLPSLAGILPHF